METKVELKCLKKDERLVNDVLGLATQQYKDLIKKECGKIVECDVIINQNKYLDTEAELR